MLTVRLQEHLLFLHLDELQLILKWRTGTRAFRLTSSSENSLVGDVFTSAETDYTAKGMVQQVQGTVVSTREPRIQRTGVVESTSIQVAVGNRVVSNSTSVIGRRNPPRQNDRDPGDRRDPLAQGFYVDQEDGMFVTSIDVFFSDKRYCFTCDSAIKTNGKWISNYDSFTFC